MSPRKGDKNMDAKVAELAGILEKRRPALAKFAHECAAMDVRNARTIAMLQKRVAMRFEDVELPGGDRVPIRTSLSESEQQHLDDLRAEYTDMVSLTPEESAREDALQAELTNTRMISPESIRRVREISKELEELHELTAAEKDRIKIIDYEIVATITADESLTVEWLIANPSAFSHEDLVWIINGFRAQQIRQNRERQERIALARSFRLHADRP